ncbi:hypothetical protein IX49_07590 [Cellulophaga lytica]|nr:hypothetical protein IX49_07590 [Cellulophaga lytica]
MSLFYIVVLFMVKITKPTTWYNCIYYKLLQSYIVVIFSVFRLKSSIKGIFKKHIKLQEAM